MVFVTSIISSQEWIRLRDAAQQAFPGEVLARGERATSRAQVGINLPVGGPYSDF